MRTHLPQNQFITHSAPARTSPGAGDAAAMRPPPVPAAADFPNPTMPTVGSAVPPITGGRSDGTAAPFGEPTSSTGGPQEAPAGSAPNTAAPAGAFVAHWEGPFWLVLLEVLEFPPIDTHETPLFVREADGYLRRNA